MLRIHDVWQVSERAPTEWCGVDQHGTRVRLRYEQGAVVIVHGNTPSQTDIVCYRRLARSDREFITYAQLRAALEGIVELPAVGEPSDGTKEPDFGSRQTPPAAAPASSMEPK